jgi:hypothetical protein
MQRLKGICAFWLAWLLVASLSLGVLSAAPEKVITGKVRFNSSAGVMGLSEKEVSQTAAFRYSDSWFLEPGTKYHHDLANMSLRLNIASWTAAEAFNTNNKNAVQDSIGFTKAAEFLRAAYRSIGFRPLHYYHYDAPMDEEEDKAAFSFAEKRVQLGGKPTVLLALVIRGGNYGGEWVSNGNVGEGQEHAGFSAAAQEITKKTEALLRSYPRSLRVKLWTTGYSRSGGIMNLVAGALDRSIAAGDSRLAKEDLYAYAFAVPASTRDPQVGDAKYENIFNVINPVDVIQILPFDAWGFRRYGQMKYLNFLNEKDDNYEQLDAAFGALFKGTYKKDQTFDLHLPTWENYIMLYLINEIFPSFMTSTSGYGTIQPTIQKALRGVFVENSLLPDISSGNYRHAFDGIFSEDGGLWDSVYLAVAVLTAPLNGPAALLGKEPVVDPGKLTLVACIAQQLWVQMLTNPPTPGNLLRSIPISTNALFRAAAAGVFSGFTPGKAMNSFMTAHCAESYLVLMSLPGAQAFSTGGIKGLKVR